MLKTVIVEDDRMVANINAQFAEKTPGVQVVAIFHSGRDALAFLPKSSANFISKGHNFAYRYAPKLYGVGYRMEERNPSPLLYEQSAKGADLLREALRADGADAAICVHVFPAMMITELRRRGELSLPAWFVATDYTCSPGVGELDMDGYCIPHPALLEEFAAAGLDPSRLHATGIPVSPDFIRPWSTATRSSGNTCCCKCRA